MTLESLQQMTWYKERPLVIRQAIDILPPICMYKFKDSGKQCHIISYEEPKEGTDDVVTVTVLKTGVGSLPGLEELNKNAVFGVGLDDLEPWED
jgi:hypothetical protein